MKKIKTMRLASVLLIAVLLSTCVISGTFAKYASTITATDSAVVAQFTVSALGVNADAVTETATVDIFNTVFDTDDANIVGDDYTAATETNDTDIDDDTTPIIAPGSWGKFSYEITNNSEVTVNYAIDYTVNEAGVPMQWSIDGKTWTDTLADVTATEIDDDTISVTIYWRWVYNGDTATDTALGFAGSATPSITIAVSFEQVD